MKSNRNRYALFLAVLLAAALCTGCVGGKTGQAVPQTSTAAEDADAGQRSDDLTREPDTMQTVENSGPAPSDLGSTDSFAASVSGEDGEAADTQTPEKSAPEINLVMVGDILLHTPVAESGKKEDGTYDFTPIFAQMKEEISEADLAIVNQEVIIGGKELGVSGYPAFNAPYELGDALADAGFDVVCQATNHALDKGKRGILNCLAFWEENYPQIAVLGIYGSTEAQSEIYVYEQEGIRAAVLNYTYGTNGIALPEDMPYAVNLLDKEQVKRDLEKASELADFVIVTPHWGTEYVLEETAGQQEWASFFAENGADLVIGTHPHVIEPVEWVDDTLVYYSLGNFVNWTSGTGEGTANRMVGAMAKVTIGFDETGEVCVTDWGVEPLVCHVESGFGGVTVYPLAEYTEELAERNEIRKQDGNFSLEYCEKLAAEVFGQ
jgi:poly-gamma-glutamate synthesis protein (capsule biosynthesis protein)